MPDLYQLFQQAEKVLRNTLKNPAAYSKALRKLTALKNDDRLSVAEKTRAIYQEFIFHDFPAELLDLAIAAEGGNPEAQTDLGLRLLYGDGVKKKPAAAREWFSKAATQGDAEAQYQYSLCLAEGVGGKADSAGAMRWLRKAAENGCDEAQFSLAEAYDFGAGVPEDHNEAFKWYAAAAEQEHPDAQYNLGCFYETGDCVELNPETAVQWFQKAADQGHAVAMDKLAWCYGEGFGVPQDLAKATHWLRNAAEQDFSDAMTHLGMCYEEGVGVPQDRDQAIKWYRKAKSLGSLGAEKRLARLQQPATPFQPDELAPYPYENLYVEYQGRLGIFDSYVDDAKSAIRFWFLGDPELTSAPTQECKVLQFMPDSEYHGSIYALFTGRAAGSGVVEHPRTYRGSALYDALDDLCSE